MTDTTKISVQKATALCRKAGLKNPADGEEHYVGSGVVLKEGGTYYFTPTPVELEEVTEPVQLKKFVEPEPAAEPVVMFTPEETAEDPIKPSDLVYRPKVTVQDAEHSPLFKGNGRHTRLFKRIKARKSAGKPLSARELGLLSEYASRCAARARANSLGAGR